MRTNEGLGRPRSADVTKAILDAALDLAYSDGVRAVTIERIASVSGVAKTTIYRRWPNSAVILMNAFLRDIGPSIEYRGSGPIKAIFSETIRSFVKAVDGRAGVLLRHLLSMAQLDEELRRAFSEQWIEPRRQMGMSALEVATMRGELLPHANHHLILDAIYGAIYYRLMVSFSPIDEAYIQNLVARTFSGLLAREEEYHAPQA
jgi:AcrR family transcriptional regulator